MSARRVLANLGSALRSGWRVRSSVPLPTDGVGQLELSPLEERRVLSASAALAMAQALAASGIEQVEQTAKSADPATPLGTDQATREPIDPGDRVVSGNPPGSENGEQGTRGPAAENLIESENRSVSPLGDSSADAAVDTAVATPLAAQVAEEAWLTLAAVGDQHTSEGANLSIEDIGTFVDPWNSTNTYHYTIDWGDGTPVDSGFATIDDFGGDGSPRLGSFDGAHTYADNGTYVVTLTITAVFEGEGFGDSSGAQFEVSVSNVAPTLTVAPNQVTSEGALLSIMDIGKFTDPGFDNPLNIGGETSEKFTYSIDWGDGTPANSGPATIDVPGGPGTPTQGSFDGSHTYADNGVYTVTVTLADDDGGVAVQTFEVTVNNVAPTLVVAPDQVVNEGALLSITNLGRITDPGFDNPLNIGGETSEKFTYAINWGDGTATQSGPVTIDIPGGPGVPTQGSFDGSHIYADNGVYAVTVTVIDDDGGMAMQSFEVVVNNVAPVLTVAPDQVVNEGSVLAIANIGQFTDPGYNNPLNVGGEVVEQFTYSINWGDGTPVQAGAPTIDIPGGPGVPTQGSFDGSHIYADNGVYTVTVTLADDDGGVAVQTFEVTVNNVAPTLVVAPDQVVNEGALLSITNLGRITDPGFDNPLNIGGETSEKFTYAINWGDGTATQSGPVTIDIPGGPGVPTQGSFDGSHIYADNGVYAVTVTVIDDDGGMAMQSFEVVVNNVAPVLTVAPDQVVNEGALLSITNIGQFTDPGFNNPLNIGGEVVEQFTYSINWGDGTPVQAGAPTIDIPGGPGVPTQGSFDGSHIYADNGVYTVTVTVVDDDGGMAVETFEVTVNNVAPTLIVAPDQVVNEGELLSITNIGQFTDPAYNNPLNVGGEVVEQFTYSINWGDGTPVQAGAPTIDIPGGPGVPTQGSFDGSHIYADNGVYTVTVTVVDDDGGMAVQSFEVTVNNVAPTLVVAPRQTDEGALLVVANIAQFTDPGFDNPLNLGGETTEQFSYTIDWGDGSPGEAGLPTIDVPGSPGVLTQGSFDGSHIYADNGVYTVTITVTDDDGGVTAAQFEVTVNNVAPTVVAPGNRIVDEGQLISLPNIGQFTDPGFDNPLNPGGATTERFTYSINWGDGTATQSGNAAIDTFGSPGVPMQGSFDGSHTYADNGVYTVTVKAIDDDGGVGTATFTITVNNVAPTLVLGTGDVSIPLTETLTINDLGFFDDPGFDNLLNVGGETTERFAFSVNWGDGTPNSNGPATIDVPGAVGLRTSGSFDSSHLYGAPGEYTVTVTLSDDDGGFAVAQFEVTVFVLRPTIIVFPPGGAGGGTPAPPPSSPAGGAVLPPPPGIVRSDLKGLRAAAVAGAEPRLVLRVVTPDGQEDQRSEQPLDDEVLDNLRTLFRRLPDGHYRIYQIQPDGIERLVVDVVVRQGRAIQLEDDVAPAAERNTAGRTDDAVPVDIPAPRGVNDSGPAESETSSIERRLPDARLEPADDEAAASQFVAAGLTATLPLGRFRKSLRRKPIDALPLTKAHRILWRR